jgi:hypothetical protein
MHWTHWLYLAAALLWTLSATLNFRAYVGWKREAQAYTRKLAELVADQMEEDETL